MQLSYFLTGFIEKCYNMYYIYFIEEVNGLFSFIKKILGVHSADQENISLIRNSKYFDEDYYKKENPNIKGDACQHYYYYGWKEGKSPSYEFSNNFYLKNYKDVEDAGINPLLHYLKSGKAENRVIEKDNGISLKKVYEEIYGCPYFYKTYICNSHIKRINLFFDEIDDQVFGMNLLFQFVLKCCKNDHCQLRIIYHIADFEILKKFLQKNNLQLPEDTVFLNLKSSNYLEIGLGEKFICTSWKNARALLNTASMNSNIYFYINSLDNLKDGIFYQVSNICCNEKIICLVDDKKILQHLNSCQLKFEINHQRLKINELNQLYCNLNDMFIVGVELLNEAFLNGVLNPEEWMVNIVDCDNDFKFHFDTNVRIRKVSKIESHANFVFQLSYLKQKNTYEVPAIIGFVEENDYEKKAIIDLSHLKEEDIISNNNKIENTKIDNAYYDFEECLKEIKEEKNV